MSAKRELYERCWLCRGTLVTQSPCLVDGMKTGPLAKPYSGPLAAGQPCPGCDGSETPGWMRVGMTGWQLEKVLGELGQLREQKAKLLAAVEGMLRHACRPGDDGKYDDMFDDVRDAARNLVKDLTEKKT